MLTAGPRGQFPRWRRSRKRLSVCYVLRCPDLWLQCSVSFVRGLEKTHAASFLNRTAGSAWETWTFAAADDVRCARLRWQINFLLTFETAPFFCVYPVLHFLSTGCTIHVGPWPSSGSISRRLYPIAIFSSLEHPFFSRHFQHRTTFSFLAFQRTFFLLEYSYTLSS